MLIRKPGQALEADVSAALWLEKAARVIFIHHVWRSRQSLQYYLRELQFHSYVYGTDHLPWDGDTPSLQTGRSIRDQMIAGGRCVRVMPQLKVEESIQTARTIFGKCYFDAEKCVDGIQALRQYRYEADKKWAAYRMTDAFLMAAVIIQEPQRKKEQEKLKMPSRLSQWS